MPAYVIMRIRAIRPAALREYRAAYGAIFRKHGGRRLAGGAAWEVLEGTRNQRAFVLWQFPSVEAARALWRSPEFADLNKLRQGAGEFDAWVLPDSGESA